VPSGKHEAIHAPGCTVRVCNTVGAGDAFNGALLAALDRHAGFPAALRYANTAAASVVSSSRGVLGLRPPAAREN
jgi:sugar/nucleoside kinase (ribokinase family)